jgi:hypothetical protein
MSKKRKEHYIFNDALLRELNKYLGLPRNYMGKIENLDPSVLKACKALKVKEIIEYSK